MVVMITLMVNGVSGFTVEESNEIWAGIRIFEIANCVPTLRNFVWSSIDYNLKLTRFDPKYAAHHTNAKGRVNDYLAGQPFSTSETGLTWSVLITGVYTGMLHGGRFAPEILSDGNRRFAYPLGNGHLPLLTPVHSPSHYSPIAPPSQHAHKYSLALRNRFRNRLDFHKIHRSPRRLHSYFYRRMER
ncbi:hypothetical protein MFRU_038g00480 [Monilinia fructicola]|nr:hypothetical protein MFRU_038g00480 [Monilinia fructicola]